MKHAGGNVLLIILVGIALFAALSYAVLQSDENLTTNREQMDLEISSLMQQADIIKASVQEMVLTRRVPVEQLEFSNDTYPTFYNNQHDNPDCNDDSCRLFAADGGGINLPNPPPMILRDCQNNCANFTSVDPYWRFFAHHIVSGFGRDNNVELFTGFRVSKDVCIAINRRLGIENPDGNPPNYSNSGYFQSYEGAVSLQQPSNISQYTFPSQFNGKISGCINQQHPTFGNERYIFYHILMPR